MTEDRGKIGGCVTRQHQVNRARSLLDLELEDLNYPKLWNQESAESIIEELRHDGLIVIELDIDMGVLRSKQSDKSRPIRVRP